MFKVNKTLERHHCSSVSIVNFEQVNAGWESCSCYIDQTIIIKQILCIHTNRLLMKQHTCVFSPLWPGLRTCKVCVTHRPWIETSARLFNCVYLEYCFYLLCLHWLLPLVLIIVRLMLSYCLNSCCDIKKMLHITSYSCTFLL